MCIEFLTFILKMNNIKKICDRYVLLIILLSILCFFSGGLLASPLDADSFFTVDIPEGWSIEARDKGCGVLLISADFDEILEVSDRIVVMFEGQIMGVFSGKNPPIEEISLAMAGK